MEVASETRRVGTALPSLDKVTLTLDSVTIPKGGKKRRRRRKQAAFCRWDVKIELPSGFVFKTGKKMPWVPKEMDGDWDPR